jgi:hypothetical protein
MKPKAQHCDECRHFLLSRIYIRQVFGIRVCGMDHSPRYYRSECGGSEFGYKRRCADFEHHDPNSKSAMMHRMRALNGDD